MSIIVYTYNDPYKLKENITLWNEIVNCPYFCVSQTLVNGLKSIYGNTFTVGRVTTIKNLTDTLYEKWVNTSCAVKQHTDIDNIIKNYEKDSELTFNELENIKKSFLFNRDEVFNSIRTMFELKLDTNNIIKDLLTPEQKFIVSVYKRIRESSKISDFTLKDNFSEDEIDDAIIKSLEMAQGKSLPKKSANVTCMDNIVLHGIHQFTPLILRTIEEISKYKKVILLINYQEQYKNIYQTWIDIYSAFDCKIINFKCNEYHSINPNDISYNGNILAQNMGKLLEGRKNEVLLNGNNEIIEFDNMTEFANYVAKIFEDASKANPEHPMLEMREQIYAADSSANDILKVYFPEQFGERQFLNYPLGHFFIAVANMWDSESNGIVITDINDIKECLESGILEEKQPGSLSSTFGRIQALFEGCISVEEMLIRIKKVRKNRKFVSDIKRKEYLAHIAYYSVSIEELQELERALNDLEDLASFFYEDFEKRPNNFKSFYKKLKLYLQDEISEEKTLSDEFVDIVKRVLVRLDEVCDIDASASFECLKSTMSLYLTQETKPGKSANWIVKNFEQIDGDVLRSSSRPEKNIMHFACLSDEDISASNIREFTWPLDGGFFEIAQNPVDWKYQVYVKSRKEYKNFKRYALLFGLEFNRGRFKLSYVKRNGDADRAPYYLLNILGIKKKRYMEKIINKPLSDASNISIMNGNSGSFKIYDYYRYRICKKRFLYESLVEGNTIYKDSFLLTKYFEVWLENETRECMQGLPCSEYILTEKLNELYDELKKYFPFAINVNRIDIVNNVKNRLNKGTSFPILSEENRKYMMIRELFVFKQLKDSKRFNHDILKDKFPDITFDKIDEELSDENLKNLNFKSNVDLWCKYCTNREICADSYLYYTREDREC